MELLARLNQAYQESRQTFLDHPAVKRHLFELPKTGWHRVRSSYLLDELAQAQLQSELLVLQECQARIQDLLRNDPALVRYPEYARYQFPEPGWQELIQSRPESCSESCPNGTYSEIAFLANWSWSVPVAPRTVITQKEHVVLPSYPEVPLLCIRIVDGYLSFLAIFAQADARYYFAMATIGMIGVTCYPGQSGIASLRKWIELPSWSKNLTSLLRHGLTRWPELELDYSQQHRAWMRESRSAVAQPSDYDPVQLRQQEQERTRKILQQTRPDRITKADQVGIIDGPTMDRLIQRQRVLLDAIEKKDRDQLVISLQLARRHH